MVKPLAGNVNVATVLGSIPPSLDTVDLEGRKKNSVKYEKCRTEKNNPLCKAFQFN